jgi:hypothetical protein
VRVEVRLRVPNMKERARDENRYPIDHQQMRFRKVVDVPALPRADDMLELPTRSGQTIWAAVVRTDWSEERVIVSYQLARARITSDEYDALASDPEWKLTHLLA